jgi:hypothetical protein
MITEATEQEFSQFSQVPVADTCNPNNSGGRDQEDCSSKPAWANSSMRPYQKKKPFKKKGSGAGGVAQSVLPEFKPQYCKKKKKRILVA